MLRSVLQWAGLAAVLGLAGAGVGALAIVKDRVEVTVQAGDAGGRPDPLALVRDELQQVHADLDAIARGLDQNLGQMAAGLEATSRRIDALASARGDDTALASVRDDLAALRAKLEGASPMAAAPGSEPPRPEPAPPLAVAATGEANAQAPPTRRFLSFSLPSSSFAFDAPRLYRVIPALSRVGFDAKSTLHDFSGVTSAVQGDVHANLADPGFSWHGSVRCDPKSLRTGVDGRDENMREHLLTAQFPEIVFDVTGFDADPGSGGIDAAHQTAHGFVRGRMTIRGKTRDVSMPVAISIDESKRVVVSGEMSLLLPDYEVPVPSKMGLISMQEQVRVWVELRARAAGPADEVRRER
jgi:polyisoprenoid-binding protein YceI